MKRKQGKSIDSFFTKHVKDTSGDCSTSSIPTLQSQVLSNSIPSLNLPPQNTKNEFETTSPPQTETPMNEGRLTDSDIANLPQDPGLRKKISEFHASDQDIVRREYCSRKLCQPENHYFPYSFFGQKKHRFNVKWFEKHRVWLEYSVEKDAAFCFACCLFKSDYLGKDAFVSDGFSNWGKPGALDLHVGGNMSAHRNAKKSLEDFKNQKYSISSSLLRQGEETKNKYRIRLEASVRCLKWLLLQGLPARGHDESNFSLSRGNFIELLKFHVEGRKDLEDFVLENAPKNCQLTSPKIQKDIINAYAKESTKVILSEIQKDLILFSLKGQVQWALPRFGPLNNSSSKVVLPLPLIVWNTLIKSVRTFWSKCCK